MRIVLLTILLLVTGALSACASPAPNLATPQRPPIAVPTGTPTAGLVTATPAPANVPPTPTPSPQGDATVVPPAATAVPVAPVQPNTKLVGSYSGILPAADAVGRIVTLELGLDGTATMTTRFIGKEDSVVEQGTWVADGDNAVVTFTQANGQPEDNRITWTLQGANLVSTGYDQAQYGATGLPLSRVGTGDIVETIFEGVSFSFDSSLAQSAHGKFLPPVPVTQAPALGGAAPQAVQFVFNGETLPDYFDPNKSQVYVYPLDELKALDPSVAQNVEALQTIIADGTVGADAQIPVFPLMPASQVFHSQARLIDFVNGTGVGFITYYAQDVAPLRSAQVFWTFQGITLDNKYYVSAFWHIGSPALPEPKDISGKEYDAFVKQYKDYLDNIVTTLDRLPTAGFVPNLSLLENMARSINASPAFPEQAPAAPTPAPQATTASAEAGVTPSPESAGASDAQTLTAEYNSVSFSFDRALAQSAQGVTIPASPVDPNVPGGIGLGAPEHIAFGFNGATVSQEVSPFEPQVRVYPTEGLQALDPVIAQEALALKTLLQVKPSTFKEPVPVFPLFNAQQALHPQVKYLTFKNGEGVRFVTFYEQDPAPITNEGLFYTFQGLSSDGKYYVTAFFPVKTDKLPNAYKDVEIKDFDAWSKQYPQYLSETDALLNGLGPDAFAPDLTLLDQMLTSLQLPN